MVFVGALWEGALFRQGFSAGILSGSGPLYKPTEVGRQLPQLPSGNGKPRRTGICAILIMNVPDVGYDSLHIRKQGVYIFVDFFGCHSTRHTFTNQFDRRIKIAQLVKE